MTMPVLQIGDVGGILLKGLGPARQIFRSAKAGNLLAETFARAIYGFPDLHENNLLARKSLTRPKIATTKCLADTPPHNDRGRLAAEFHRCQRRVCSHERSSFHL